MVLRSGFFPGGLVTQNGHFGAIRANLKMVFLRKIHFFANPIWAQNGLFLTHCTYLLQFYISEVSAGCPPSQLFLFHGIAAEEAKRFGSLAGTWGEH